MKRAAAFILVVWIFAEKIDGLAYNRSSTKQQINTSETAKANKTEVAPNTTSSTPLPTGNKVKTTDKKYENRNYIKPTTRKSNRYRNNWFHYEYDPCDGYYPPFFGYVRKTGKSSQQYCLDGCRADKGCYCSSTCRPQSCPEPKTEYKDEYRTKVKTVEVPEKDCPWPNTEYKVIYRTKVETVEVPRKDCPHVEFRNSTIALAILMVIAVVIIFFLAVKVCGGEEDDVVVKEGMETETIFDPTTFTFMTIPLRKKEGEEKKKGKKVKREKKPMTAEEVVMTTLATI